MIPFNRPYLTGNEIGNIKQAHENGHLSGDGPFTKHCHIELERMTGATKALLTHSCTAALEMTALLLGLEAGDEVIMPSFTFVSTANAFVLRGAVPVFVDIRPDTLNIDETLIESAITSRTKAICVVHYAGVSCEMSSILELGKKYGIPVIEDAAQGVHSFYEGRALGTLGELGAFSFHETKNIISGEGGALLCRDSEYAERSEIIREKGTNRSRFFRGQVDKYTWVDLGSSYLPGEVTAAFLSAQLQEVERITQARLKLWDQYHEWAARYEKLGILRRPIVPSNCKHNAHMYYLLLPSLAARTKFISELRERGVQSVFHYIPLHSSPGGSNFGRAVGDMSNTDELSERLVRMPLWIGLGDQMNKVLSAADAALSTI